MTELVVIDGCGSNLTSLCNALGRLNANAIVSHDHKIIEQAERVILPGVGAAGDAMTSLRAKGLDTLIPNLKQPVLGICVGMQLLFNHSAEDDTDCLGVIPGSLYHIPKSQTLPVPHMGWNRVQSGHELFEAIPDSSHFYFVHSYAAETSATTIASSIYGKPFTAAAQQDNFLGVQFHPERSGKYGAQILKNYLSWSGK
ncbi:MAG: imidazole glycerol phosphate synthase subunit HisH [Pseudomonadota bacterium]